MCSCEEPVNPHSYVRALIVLMTKSNDPVYETATAPRLPQRIRCTRRSVWAMMRALANEHDYDCSRDALLNISLGKKEARSVRKSFNVPTLGFRAHDATKWEARKRQKRGKPHKGQKRKYCRQLQRNVAETGSTHMHVKNCAAKLRCF